MATLKNTTVNDTQFFTLPAGTTAQRPASPVQGMTRYNTTLGYIEWYDGLGATWRPIYQSPNVPITYLLVAGGGGGGYRHGAGTASTGGLGGGGAGGTPGFNNPGIAGTANTGGGGGGASTSSGGNSPGYQAGSEGHAIQQVNIFVK